VQRRLRGDAHTHVEGVGVVAVEGNLNSFIVELGAWGSADVETPVHGDGRKENFRRLSRSQQEQKSNG
jgi:hypothetical protein